MSLQILDAKPEGTNKAFVLLGSNQPAELTGLQAKQAVLKIAATQCGLARAGISGSYSLGYLTKEGEMTPDVEYLAGKLPPGGLHVHRYDIQGSL